MKRTLLNFMTTIIVVSGCLSASAQQDSVVQYITMTLYAKNYETAKTEIRSAVQKLPEARINEYRESNSAYRSNRSVYMVVVLPGTDYDRLDTLVESFGRIQDKQVTTVDNSLKINKLKLELEYLQERLAKYEAEKVNITSESENYFEFFEDMREIERRIFVAEKALQEARNEVRFYTLRLTVREEIGMPDGSDQYYSDFVNMPGIEYIALFIENSETNFSADFYQGGGLKYMFHNRKSYIMLSGLRATGDFGAGEERTVTEIFMYAFGQDFYPSHFGSGTRTWFNLYTGGTVGGIFATGDEGRDFGSFQITPHFGLELFKNKYVLFDMKVGYFLPFTYNQNMRGLTANAAFNFLF